MRASELRRPLGVFVAVVLVALVGTAVLGSFAATGSSGDGADVRGQSPEHYQPDSVIHEADPEDGDLSLDGGGSDKRVLVDSAHSNRYDEADLEPLVEVLVANGHDVDLDVESDDGFGESGYGNATLQEYDAFLSVAPTGAYSEREVAALEAFADGDGRIVLLGEPTQYGSGAIESSSSTRAAGDDLAAAFGLRVGADRLYNVADEGNDNNYESVYADAVGSDPLVDGVDRVQLDTAGYLVETGGGDVDVLARAVEGTKTFDRGETGEYPVAAANGNFALVADASFVQRSELYDADNERFVTNLLTFLVSGDKAEDVPPTEDRFTPSE